jgi:tetratricopeptide (TPR) repeat protein
MKFRRYFLFFACIAFCTPLIARETISDAWREYDYQNFDGAARIFGEVLKDRAAAPEQRIQARLGIAMVVHYRIPGGDPERAIPMYRAVLDSLPRESAVRPNVLLLIGRAYAQMKKPMHDSAQVYFRKIDAEYPGTVESDEAALEQAYILSYRQTEPDFRNAIRFLQEYCDRSPGNTLASTMHMFCARLAQSLKDLPLARAHLIVADSLGVVNIRNRPIVMYQIAFISDTKLNDPATAKKYYRKLITTYSTDGHAFFCKMRLKELGDTL